MNKINFKNLPDTSTPLSAENLNLLQDNVEGAITLVETEIPIIDDEISTTSTNGIENQAITNYVDSEIATKQDTLTTTTGAINVSLANTNIEKNQYIKYGKIVNVQLVFTTQNQIGQWSYMEIANGLPQIDTNYTNNRFEFYGFGDGYDIRSAITELGQISIFYNHQQIPANTQLKFYATYISKD